MRSLLIAAAVLFLPAAAQARPPSSAPIADTLPSPEAIDRGASALGRVVDGLMQVDVGSLADAIDPHRRYAGEPETLGDLTRRNDPYVDERIDSAIGSLADSMIVLRGTMHRLEPALRRSLNDIARSVDEAMLDLPRRREYRDYGDYYGD